MTQNFYGAVVSSGNLFALVTSLLAGNDTLIGSAGADVVLGFAGGDTLLGGAGGDQLNGGADVNTASYANAATGLVARLASPAANTGDAAGDSYVSIQNLTGSRFGDTLGGDAGINVVDGGAGNDVLDGGGNFDILKGGLGDDTFVLGNSADTVIDTGGIDTITSIVARNLASYGAIEKLTLLGASNINGAGNGLANTLTGNNAVNTLDGGAGSDRLIGLGGADILIGNAGKDTSTGGLGNDLFRFSATSHSPVGAGADVITDFDDYGDDRIDLAAVYGGTLGYRHNGAFTAAGQVRINDIAGADLIVELNTGGSLAADMQIRLTATLLTSINAGDFIL